MCQKRVLVACEFSGVVRDAFLDRGFDAVSCDILPGDSSRGRHKQVNVCDIIGDEWDLIIAHPPCTYLCNSSVRWLHTDIGRWFELFEACKFFKRFLSASCIRVAVENPIPHKYAMEIIGQPYSQCIQPWQFGHGEIKATCLWLKNLPPLQPTNIVEGRKDSCHKTSPGPNRGYWRSITYSGIANAMAEQWGTLLLEETCKTSANT